MLEKLNSIHSSTISSTSLLPSIIIIIVYCSDTNQRSTDSYSSSFSSFTSPPPPLPLLHLLLLLLHLLPLVLFLFLYSVILPYLLVFLVQIVCSCSQSVSYLHNNSQIFMIRKSINIDSEAIISVSHHFSIFLNKLKITLGQTVCPLQYVKF